MKNILGELWHGNISPQEDCRTNTPEMKQLMEYMARHRDDLFFHGVDLMVKFLQLRQGVGDFGCPAIHRVLHGIPYLQVLILGAE